MALDQGEFFRGRDKHGIGAGGGHPVAVLAGMVDIEAMGVVLDRTHPPSPSLELGNDLFQEGGLAFR